MHSWHNPILNNELKINTCTEITYKGLQIIIKVITDMVWYFLACRRLHERLQNNTPDKSIYLITSEGFTATLARANMRLASLALLRSHYGIIHVNENNNNKQTHPNPAAYIALSYSNSKLQTAFYFSYIWCSCLFSKLKFICLETNGNVWLINYMYNSYGYVQPVWF